LQSRHTSYYWCGDKPRSAVDEKPHQPKKGLTYGLLFTQHPRELSRLLFNEKLWVTAIGYYYAACTADSSALRMAPNPFMKASSVRGNRASFS